MFVLWWDQRGVGLEGKSPELGSGEVPPACQDRCAVRIVHCHIVLRERDSAVSITYGAEPYQSMFEGWHDMSDGREGMGQLWDGEIGCGN